MLIELNRFIANDLINSINHLPVSVNIQTGAILMMDFACKKILF